MLDLTVVSIAITALATLGIFVFTYLNYTLYVKIREGAETQQQQFADLFEGIIIATLLSGPTSYGKIAEAKRAFQNEYKGETNIFKNDANENKTTDAELTIPSSGSTSYVKGVIR